MGSGAEEMIIRRMTVDDVDKVWAIEQASFTTPWTRETFVYEMLENDCAIYLVGELAGQVVGYVGVWFVQDQATVTNIAVNPNFRGLKIGEKMLREMIRIARIYGIVQLSLEVRVSNMVAQNLYRKLGFQDGGIRKRYYQDNYEDALVMWVEL